MCQGTQWTEQFFELPIRAHKHWINRHKIPRIVNIAHRYKRNSCGLGLEEDWVQ